MALGMRFSLENSCDSRLRLWLWGCCLWCEYLGGYALFMDRSIEGEKARMIMTKSQWAWRKEFALVVVFFFGLYVGFHLYSLSQQDLKYDF